MRALDFINFINTGFAAKIWPFPLENYYSAIERKGRGINESFEINPADILAIRQKVHDEEKQQKLENYQRQNRYILPHQYLFTGSSLMEQFPISEYWMEEKLYETTGKICYNRAIGGYL